MIDPASLRACSDELEKSAVLREAVRFGLKDVPRTPRLLMKGRGLLERATAAERMARKYEGAVSEPIKRKLSPVAQKLPEEVRVPLTTKTVKPRAAAEKGVDVVAADPLGNVASNLVPFPGAFAAYHGAKAGGRKLINVGVQIPRGKGKKPIRLMRALDPLPEEVAAQARRLAVD